ncbi:MAG: ABC transporter ATP-binding protein [Thermoplasmataceae archaeon]
MIKLENVVKSYSGTVALSGINLNIEPGQIHGILGPNGSGKTTMLKLISAILRPTSGNVTVNDLNTVNDSARIKEIIGYVPETPALYESMSVMEYLDFIGSVRNVDREKFIRRGSEFIKAFELTGNAGEYIGNLSFGTRQKVAIIAALIHDPEIIVLDEAMNGLDPRSSKILKDLLVRMSRSGRTIVFSTHIMEVAQRVCTTISILYNGRIVDTGSFEELEKKYSSGAGNLEDVFLKMTGSQDLDPTVQALIQSLGEE